MPRNGYPPTPAPSTDINGKDNGLFASENPIFTLPPSAIGGRTSSSSEGSMDVSRDNPGLLSPTSPKQAYPPRKKNSIVEPSKSPADITLPPPPTRSRKIIQMKPSSQQGKKTEQPAEPRAPLTLEKAKTTSPTPNGKRKQAANSSAGRKIARKTAHSIIERRRRSKMNEEFGVLKDMIPACTGQEMHKLAILQASIEYLRYLEQCVTDLKAGRNHQEAMIVSPSASDHTPPVAELSEDDSDEDMEDDDDTSRPSPQEQHHMLDRYQSAPVAGSTLSPAFSASSYHSHHRFSKIELPSSSHFESAYSQMQPPSGKFSISSYFTTPVNLSTNTSPLMLPQISNELDHEASTALLMLNATDRRLAPLVTSNSVNTDAEVQSRTTPTALTPKTASGIRGMSVQDLLRS